MWIVTAALFMMTRPGFSYRLGRAARDLTQFEMPADVGAAIVATGVFLALLFGIVSIVVAIRHPARGVADRLAGTVLVPR
jgi:hypothetical protein